MKQSRPIKRPRLRNVARRAATSIASLFLLLPTVVHACPTCKDGIADGINHVGMVQGYFWSIVFMMSMPFLIFGGVAAYFYLQVRKARADGRFDHPVLAEIDPS